jgi:hypothetical protein
MRNFLVLALVCANVFGETVKMKDDPIRSRISLKHLNRIVVKNDRISSVFGLDEAFHFEKNEKTGEGHIKPTAENGYDPVSISVTTVSGKTQDFILNVDDGEPNVLVPEGAEIAKEDTNDISSDFETSVIEAMKSLINGVNLRILELGKKPERDVSGFKIDFMESYQAGEFIGCKYKITAQKDAPVELNERYFLKDGDAALSFSNTTENRPLFLYVLRRR